MPIPVPISAHNEPLPGDELSTIQFNYEWRRLVAELIWPLTFDSFWDGTDADVTDAVSKARALIEDLYTLEPVGGDVHIGARISLDANFSLSPIGWMTPSFPDPSLDTDNFDTSGFYSGPGNTRLIVPAGQDGVYRVHAQASYLAGTNANLGIRIAKGGTVGKAQGFVKSAGQIEFDCTCLIPLVAGDFVQLQLFVSATRTVRSGGTADFTFLDIQRVMDTP